MFVNEKNESFSIQLKVSSLKGIWMKHAPNLKYVQILQNLSKHDKIF